jgi:hypothetical protein
MVFPSDVIFLLTSCQTRLGPLSNFIQNNGEDQPFSNSKPSLKSFLFPATFVPLITVAHREVLRIPSSSNDQVPKQLCSSAKRLMLEQACFLSGQPVSNHTLRNSSSTSRVSGSSAIGVKILPEV